ncbi:Uncharacterized protein Rs2_48812 [Raphanus sativus]|nr:Uncharacterized protein Rs2_48812 [Raphanus sativus]
MDSSPLQVADRKTQCSLLKTSEFPYSSGTIAGSLRLLVPLEREQSRDCSLECSPQECSKRTSFHQAPSLLSSANSRPVKVFSENSVIHGFIHAARATVHLYEATETVPSIYSGFTMPLWRNPSDAFQIVAYSLCQSVALVLIHFCRCGGCNGFRKQS